MAHKEWIMNSVREQMPEKRWRHTEGVIQSAIQLAKQYGSDPSKAELAAILHDVAKYWPVERQREVLIESGYAEDLLAYDKPLWHGPVGAYVAQKEYGIADQDILNAIRYHTSGRVGMSLLEKVICLADYIEPGRDFPGVEDIRRLSASSLEEALVEGLDGTIRFLLEQKQIVYPMTILARNALLKEAKETKHK
ncbi:bis(5'-nucleosyl)-tetraphosphatase (symmetrical) YqeK [Marinicrinis lubricantis]|uniref:bis(5'-nucleosyl)-tetraphosphatase (symmetrical) n=1 Tax=Marinicrinis lubricantis TaxID=2086470 RepID=A0ABW1IUU7_9BACL